VDDFSNTSPVGSFQPNRFGLFDMGGNVWQWCEDWYDGGRQYRVLRGASWFSSTAEFLSSSFRHFDPGTPNDNYGFRVVLAAGSSVTGDSATLSGSLPATNMITKESAPLQSTLLQPTRPQPERPWTNTLGMRFVPVPGTPVLFCVWLTRVRDFSTFVSATDYDAGPGWKEPGFSQSATDPVCDVSWIDAVKFCQWLTATERRLKLLGPNDEYRLPTDEEWTAAADNTHFPWGDHWPPPKGAGNYTQKAQVDDYENTSPVGSFQPNHLGLYDMGGNLWEWCGDWYRNEMNSEENRNLHPLMKNDGGGQSFRVLRGASWRDGGLRAYLVTACRNHSEPDARHDNQGFRCVLVVGSSP
jgi:formylglycine-generating enzyme required for sulfatase activity